MEDNKDKGASRATCSSRLAHAYALLRNSVLAAVNPRFTTFTYAFTLAIIVGLLTFGAVVGITVSLMSQCSKSCGLQPVVWLEQEEEPKWYTPIQEAISVSYRSKERLKDMTCINDQAGGMSSRFDVVRPQLDTGLEADTLNQRNSIEFSTQTWVSSKCSVLHTADCGRKEWASLYQGLLAIANVSRGLPAAWPTTAAYSQYSADQALKTVLSMDCGQPVTEAVSKIWMTGIKIPQRVPEMPECLLNSRSPGTMPMPCFMSLSHGAAAGVNIFTAPPEAKCCNVSVRAEAYRDNYGGTTGNPGVYDGTRWALEVRGRQDKMDSCLEYTGSDYKGDCTMVWLQATMYIMPPAAHLFSGGICQDINATTGDVFANLAGFFDLSSRDCTFNSTFRYTNTTDTSSPSYMRAKTYEEQAAAALDFLLPLLYNHGSVASWYMANASISQSSTSTGDKTMTADNVIARHWLKANLYCCKCNYPDLLASLGSALGYSGYIEVVATLAVLLLYLQMVRADNTRLRLSLATLARIAMEAEEDKDKEGDDSGNTGNKDTNLDNNGAAATIKLVKPEAKDAGSGTLQPVQLLSQASTLARLEGEGAQPSPRVARRGPTNVRTAGMLPGVAS